MIKLREYQNDIAHSAVYLLAAHKIAYLSMQVRTGKTITSLEAAKLYGAQHVLFITKKKVISSIMSDYNMLQPGFKITVINYEAVIKLDVEGFDLVICDEAHCLGQYPKPSQRTEQLKNICNGLPIIYLSGTPTPESYSQIYHQFYISSFSPFALYSNFYKWAKEYVNVTQRFVFNRQMNDYSKAKQESIKEKTSHLFLSYTQEEAGFIQDVKESVLVVEMQKSTIDLANKIKRDRVYVSKSGAEILADTEVKLMQKLHQIYSGTVKDESGGIIEFDPSKAQFIKQHFEGQKIAIFYKFIGEMNLLKKTFGQSVTMCPDEFRESQDKTFISQIQSGREGINLSTADCLIMYNIDFSSVSYQQAKARIQAKDRQKECLLYWIFAEGGIEKKIYDRVIGKQDFTLSYFRKIYDI